MISEISFYQCQDTVARSIVPLLLKVLEEDKKVLIIASDKFQIKEIDNNLWNYGKNKFIPHITSSDKDFAKDGLKFTRQPIIISDQEENLNEADYLVIMGEVSEEFISKFSRAFYFYDILRLEEAKRLAPKYKAIAGKFDSYMKENTKWIRNSL